MDKKEEVLGALADWVINVTAKKEKATSEELEALPKVAEVFLQFQPTMLGIKSANVDIVETIVSELKKTTENL